MVCAKTWPTLRDSCLNDNYLNLGERRLQEDHDQSPCSQAAENWGFTRKPGVLDESQIIYPELMFSETFEAYTRKLGLNKKALKLRLSYRDFKISKPEPTMHT